MAHIVLHADTTIAEIKARGAVHLGDIDHYDLLEYIRNTYLCMGKDTGMQTDPEDAQISLAFAKAAEHIQAALDEVGAVIDPEPRG